MSKVRLPIPGEDQGNWGEILNEFLLVALKNDGTLKAEDVILAKANSSDVVHNSGVETVSGAKTFLSAPIVPSPSAPMHAVNKTYTDTALSGKVNAADLADVATSGSYLDLTDTPAARTDITKADVGLGNVDNTADSAKPVSTAAQTALNLKANTADLSTVATTGSYNNLLDKPSIPDNTTVVHLSDTQTITGTKDFTGGLKVSGVPVVAMDDARLTNTRTPTDGTVTTAKVVDAAITGAKLSAAVQATLAKADSAVTQTALDLKANLSSLSQVATTGSYSNLLDKPSIPDDATVVHLSDVQTITGAKDFTGGLKVSGVAVIATDDARLSNTRTPSDDTVTTAKVVDAAITSAKLSAAVQATLAKADSAIQTEQVTSVAGKTGVVTLVKGDVGLSNVDNTSDAAKPVSSATLTALNAKANTADLSTVATTGSYSNLLDKPSIPDSATVVHLADVQTITGAKNFTGGLQSGGQAVVATNDARLSDTRTPTDGTVTNAKLSAAIQASLAKADSALQTEQITSVAGKTGVVTLAKGDVGLGNVDNTADSAKPVSTAAQTALNLKANTADLATVATSGSYSNLLNKPTIPVAGTTTGTYAAGDDGRIAGALQNSIVTAKGDLLVATANATVARLGAGSDGQVLSADSSQAQGVKWSTLPGNTAIVRTIASISTNTTAGATANTDYVYIASAALTLTLPTAVGNTNSYTIKNTTTNSVTVATTASQLIDGSAQITVASSRAYVLYSDNTNWIVT